MKRLRRLLAIALATSNVGAFAMPARAQSDAATPPTDQAPKQAALSEDIIVTATKRALNSNAQNTPIAVTAVGEDQLARTFSVTVTDVGKLAPNVQLSGVATYPGFANFRIRGVGVNNSVRSVDPAVNIIQDGMVLGYQVGTLLDTFDTESVEILRGPQGILFGKNSTGGVVSLKTRAPTEAFGVRGDLTAGSFNRIDGSLSVEGALVPGKVRAKIAFLTRNSDGYFKDRNGGTFSVAPGNPSGLQPPNPTSNQADTRLWAIKPMLVIDASSALTVTLIGQYYHDTGGGATTRDIQPGGLKGAAFNVYGYTPPSDPTQINHDLADEGHRLTEYHTIGQIDLRTDFGVFTSVSAYRHVDYWSSLDLDGTPFIIAEFPDSPENSSQFSQELRFASSFSDKLELLAGAYYLDVKSYVQENRHFSPTSYTRGEFNQTARDAAGFVDATYSITPKLKLSAGGRYTHETKIIDVVPLSTCGVNFTACPTTSVHKEKSWNDFSPQVAVNYQIEPHILTYASWTKGFRSGNFNARTANPLAIGPTNPESVESYEVGFKSDLFDRKVRFNIAAFYMNYDDIQKTVFTPVPGSSTLVQTLNNAASAKIYGVEIDGRFQPVKALLLEGNFGWTKAKYDEFRGLDLNGDGKSTAADDALAKNLQFERLPEFSYLVAGTYTVPLAHGDLALRASWDWRSHQFVDVPNTPAIAQDAYGELDMDLRYTTPKWSASLFGKNLTKSVWHDLGSVVGGYQIHGGLASVLYGVELRFKI